MSIENTIAQSSSELFLEFITRNMPVWFQEGGIVMWLLLLISFFATVVTLERLFFWGFYYSQNEHLALQKCYTGLNRRNRTEALLACQSAQTPALKMLECAVNALPFSPKEKIQVNTETQISLVSRGHPLLRTVIIMAPMLGILGTVLGIIDSFNILNQQATTVSATVIGGVAQSLKSTAFGFSIAILALLPYSLFRVLIQKLILHLEKVRSEFNYICQQKNLITNESSAVAKRQEKAEDETMSSEKKMPYHYEISEDTGEVNVSIHPQAESIKRTTPSSIAEMYNQELPLIYKHIKPESDTEAQDTPSDNKRLAETLTDDVK